ncbi:ribonuclease domain-containing protein [Acidipropionibacterium acidipropionici]
MTYKEWDLSPKTPGIPRDSRRILTGSDGSAYETNDHYGKFVKIR